MSPTPDTIKPLRSCGLSIRKDHHAAISIPGLAAKASKPRLSSSQWTQVRTAVSPTRRQFCRFSERVQKSPRLPPHERLTILGWVRLTVRTISPCHDRAPGLTQSRSFSQGRTGDKKKCEE
jgi:hypothetical protein